MAEPLGELTRTHTCGALRPEDVEADVVLLGWVHRVRDLGGVLFVDVRDRAGITQVVFDKDDETLMAKAKRLRSEFVVGVEGRVRRRSVGQPIACAILFLFSIAKSLISLSLVVNFVSSLKQKTFFTLMPYAEPLLYSSWATETTDALDAGRIECAFW